MDPLGLSFFDVAGKGRTASQCAGAAGGILRDHVIRRLAPMRNRRLKQSKHLRLQSVVGVAAILCVFVVSA